MTPAIDKLISSVEHLKWEESRRGIIRGIIRCAQGDCPIIAAAFEQKLATHSDQHGMLNLSTSLYYLDLGLTEDEALTVIYSADNSKDYEGYSDEVREAMERRLLKKKY